MAQAYSHPLTPPYGGLSPDITVEAAQALGYTSSYGSPGTPLGRGVYLHPMIAASNRYASTIAHPPSPNQVLWLASRCVGASSVAMIPPFRNEEPESWRAVAIEGLSRHTKATDILQPLKPYALESVRQAVDCYGTYRFELRFLNHTAALLFYARFLLDPPVLDGPAMPSLTWVPAPPISQDMWDEVNTHRATRILLIEREIDGDSQESVRLQLLEALSGFGVVQSIALQPRTALSTSCGGSATSLSGSATSSSCSAPSSRSSISEKTCTWEVSFTCLESAVKARRELRLKHITAISFARDALVPRLQKHAASLYLAKSPYNPANLRGLRSHELMDALAHQSLAAIIVDQLSGGEFNVGNRCVCISRLPPGTQLVEICNTVRGGMIETVKLVPERNTCFVTFLEATAAAQFWATYQMRPLNVNCERVRVGWGRNPGPVAPEIASIVGTGATRNLCIQIDAAIVEQFRNSGVSSIEPPLVLNEKELYRTFSPFGTIEQIRVASDVCCSFVTFTGIVNAVQAVDWARDSHQFSGAQIQYGKDRCAALPRCIARSHNTEAVLVQYLRRKLPAMLTQAQAQAVVRSPVPYGALGSPYTLAVSPSIALPYQAYYFPNEEGSTSLGEARAETYPKESSADSVFGGSLPTEAGRS